MRIRVIVILLIAVMLLLPAVVSCAPAAGKETEEANAGTEKYTSDLGLGFRTYINQGDWVYYTAEGKLFKIRPNGIEKTLVCDESAIEYIIYQDYIFYIVLQDSTLYRMNIDGTGKVTFCEDINLYLQVRDLAVSDGWVYFYKDGYKLHRMRIDGTDETELPNIVSTVYSIEGEWIYYLSVLLGDDGALFNLFRMRTDGSENEKLTQENCAAVDYWDGWIYYIDELRTGVYKVRFDGSAKQLLAERGGSRSRFIKVIDDWVYYLDGGLYAVNINGGESTIVTEDSIDARMFDIWDNWIVYVNTDLEVWNNRDASKVYRRIRIKNSYNTDAAIEAIFEELIDGFVFYAPQPSE